MVEIRDERDLDRWLGGRSPQVTLPIANRTLFRGIPALASEIDTFRIYSAWKNKLILQMLRASMICQASTRYYSEGGFYGDLFYTQQALEKSLQEIPDYQRQLSGIVQSFLDLARASDLNPLFQEESVSVFEFLITVDLNAASLHEDLLAPAAVDIANVESGVDLWSQPLWLDDIPEWAAQGWENLATELTKRTPYWKTLVRWYEDRLKGDDWAASQGRPAIRELEIARASLPDSYWKKGGKAVNLAIAELEDFFWNNVPLKDPALRDLVNGIGVITDDEEGEIITDDTSAPLDALPPIDALPEQSSSGMTFDRSAGGPISLAPPSGNDVLLATPDRIEDYLELRRKAMDVLAEGANRLGRLGKPLHLFCELPADLTSVRAKVLWGHINALRIVLKGHDEAVRAHAAGLDPDDRRLDGFAADGLQDIVETANVFFAGDPNLIDLDAIRRGPREQAEAKAEIARIEKPLKEALNNGAITEAETGAIVEAQITTALNAPDTLDGRQATELGAKTVRNYVAMLVRALRGELPAGWKGAREGAYREIGKYALISGATVVSPFAQDALHFVGVHANELLGYVHTAFQNADLETLIRILSQLN